LIGKLALPPFAHHLIHHANFVLPIFPKLLAISLQLKQNLNAEVNQRKELEGFL
jgi:hypothetical protein